MSLLTVSTVQGALKDARAHVETLEGRLEEAEGYRGQADILKLQLQELEVGTVAGKCYGKGSTKKNYFNPHFVDWGLGGGTVQTNRKS